MSIESVAETVPVGYKQTEVGVIPEDWEVVRLGDYVSYLGSGATNTKSRGNFPLYGSTGVIGSCERPEYEGESLLVARVGVNAGRLYSVCGEYGVSDNTILIKIEQKNNINFVKYCLIRKNLNSLVFGSGQPLITGTQLKNLFLPFPSVKEQTIIANALSDVDALNTKLESLIAKKQAIKNATMQQLLTGSIRLPEFGQREDGSSKGTKQSELGEIPEDWEPTFLGEVAIFLKGSGLAKNQLKDSGMFECIHYGQLFTQLGRKVDRVLIRTDFDGGVRSKSNDILMPTSDVTPTGLATASCITKDDVVLGGDILIIRSESNKLNGVFFAYLISLMREEVMKLVTGSTVYHLYGTDMAKFAFAMPCFKEQTIIATILSDMDEEIQGLELRLNKIRQIKQGMMQELLTGKTRLIEALKGEYKDD